MGLWAVVECCFCEGVGTLVSLMFACWMFGVLGVICIIDCFLRFLVVGLLVYVSCGTLGCSFFCLVLM